MGLKLKLNKGKGKEKANIEDGLLSKVSGKVILKTPFGKREILKDGKIKKIK